MVANLPDLSQYGIPHELVEATYRLTAQSAQRVGEFLHDLGLRGTPEEPCRLPASFLLYLGAALQLLDWEWRGLPLPDQAGVPAGREAVRAAFARPISPAEANVLTNQVLGLFIQHFAWHALEELGAP